MEVQEKKVIADMKKTANAGQMVCATCHASLLINSGRCESHGDGRCEDEEAHPEDVPDENQTPSYFVEATNGTVTGSNGGGNERCYQSDGQNESADKFAGLTTDNDRVREAVTDNGHERRRYF